MSRRGIPKDTIYFKLPVFAVDVLVHCMVFEAVLWIMAPTLDAAKYSDIDQFFGPVGLSLLVVSYILSIFLFGFRLHERKMSMVRITFNTAAQTAVTAAVFMWLVALEYKVVPRRFFFFDFVSVALILSLVHCAIYLFFQYLRKTGRNTLKVVMVGADENSISLYDEMNEGMGVKSYDVLGFFTSTLKNSVPSQSRYLGKVSQCADFLRRESVDEVYCSLSPDSDSETIDALIALCQEKGCTFYYVPNMDGYLRRRMVWSEIGNSTIIKLREEPLDNPLSKLLKRTMDIVISLLFLVLAYPLIWCFVAIGIKISSPGPILFRQKRTGYSGKTFNCLKFRSMKVNVDADKIQATADDPRKTKFGDFIRRTSIDELPQFINVLKGDMSIVGPRPHMLTHTDQYSELLSDYMVRHLVKPGITGHAQVSGCRGETKTLDDMRRRVECDIWYIEHWSILLDIEIFFKTIWQVLSGDEQAV